MLRARRAARQATEGARRTGRIRYERRARPRKRLPPVMAARRRAPPPGSLRFPSFALPCTCLLRASGRPVLAPVLWRRRRSAQADQQARQAGGRAGRTACRRCASDRAGSLHATPARCSFASCGRDADATWAATTGRPRCFTALTEDYPELPDPYNNLAGAPCGAPSVANARRQRPGDSAAQ